MLFTHTHTHSYTHTEVVGGNFACFVTCTSLLIDFALVKLYSVYDFMGL